MVDTGMMDAIVTDRSNSLADLAARIRTEHEATATALKRSVLHAMAAGDLLLEAKTAVPHGKWLCWFADNCTMSARTAQLYMKLAKNRAKIEKEMANPQSVADLTLNEAAALCVLAGRMEQLIEFAKRAEVGNADDLVEMCIAQGFSVIRDDGYDPFFHCEEKGKHDWCAFALFLVHRWHWTLRAAAYHVEYVLQRQFKNPDEWLGEEGRKFRSMWSDREPSPLFKAKWVKFAATQANRSTAELEDELNAIAKAEKERDHWS
jgi:Protein of unknown function (DUF3102)